MNHYNYCNLITKYSLITSAHLISQRSYNMDWDKYIHIIFTDYPKSQRDDCKHICMRSETAHTHLIKGPKTWMQ